MFKVVLKQGGVVFIADREDARLFKEVTFKGARARKSRGAKIRNPVVEEIDGQEFIFTANEWAKGQTFFHETLFSSLHIYRVRGREILDKVKMSLSLARQRNVRLIIEADAAAARQHGE